MGLKTLPNWYAPGKPGELRTTPWMHPAVVGYIEQYLDKETTTVLEHGSGGSTVWFSDRVKWVDTVEHNKEWADVIKALELDNVSVWDKQELPQFFIDQFHGFDVILIDGERTMRPSFAFDAPEIINPGGLIIFDNANRPEEEYMKARAWLRGSCEHFIFFDNNPPGHNFATTEIYRAKGGADDQNWI